MDDLVKSFDDMKTFLRAAGIGQLTFFGSSCHLQVMTLGLSAILRARSERLAELASLVPSK